MSIAAMSWAFDQEVTGNDKLVLLAIADHADADGSCFPGHPVIAKKASVSERTVQRCLERLRELGLISWERRHSDGTGYRSSNRYHLQLPGLTDTLSDWPNGQNEPPNGQLWQLEGNHQLEPSVTKERRTKLPASWTPTDDHRALAKERGVDVDEEADVFRLHAEANDRLAVRWNAAFTMWLKKARPKVVPIRGTHVAPAPKLPDENETERRRLAAIEKSKRETIRPPIVSKLPIRQREDTRFDPWS